MTNINVNIKQENIKYEIIFSKDFICYLKENIKNINNKKLLFVFDSNIYKLYYKKGYFDFEGLNYSTLVLKNGEKNKTITSVFRIIDKLFENNFSRKDYVIAVGGGVTGDISGFASSLFKRGINFVQIPTTILSMFDSSVGGKTGVDYKGFKNGIGSFYNPDLVIINQEFLKTLPKNELISGYFEGLKHAILSGEKDFQDFSKIFKNIISKKFDNNTNKIISSNINFKLSVVKSDPFETKGNRKILNYGHTMGHAIETFSNFKLGHGICVGFGIIYANIVSYNLQLLDEKTKNIIENFIKEILKNYKLGKLDFEELYKLMQNDKKNENSQISFILLKNFGETIEQNISKEILEKSFKEFITLF